MHNAFRIVRAEEACAHYQHVYARVNYRLRIPLVDAAVSFNEDLTMLFLDDL